MRSNRVQRRWGMWRFTVGDCVTDRDVYEQLRVPLMRFAASLVGPDEAPDLVSEVLVATMQRRSLSSLENPRAYLLQAVLNRARSRGRQSSRERQALSKLKPASRSDEPSGGSDPDVVPLVASLPARQRAAVFLVYWEDLPPSEAAELLGVRPATLRRYLHLAREKLRRQLDD